MSDDTMTPAEIAALDQGLAAIAAAVNELVDRARAHRPLCTILPVCPGDAVVLETAGLTAQQLRAMLHNAIEQLAATPSEPVRIAQLSLAPSAEGGDR